MFYLFYIFFSESICHIVFFVVLTLHDIFILIRIFFLASPFCSILLFALFLFLLYPEQYVYVINKKCTCIIKMI